MNKKRVALISVALIITIGTLTGFILNRNVHAENGLVVTGTLVGKEVDINSKIPGRIVKLYVSDGQKVKAGQLIAKISDEELLAKKAQAQALVDAAKSQLDQANLAVELQRQVNQTNVNKAMGAYQASVAQLKKARNGARTQEIAQAQASYDLWLKTSQRVHKLYAKGAVAAQKVDEVDTQLKVAEETLKMAKEGARKEDIEAAAAMAESAKASLEQANAGLLQTSLAEMNVAAAKAKYEQALAGLKEVEAYLKDTEIKAPAAGEVSVIYVENGELISTGMPIATITSDDSLWVEVKVRETDLDKVSLHQKVEVELPTGTTYPGEVAWINRKPDFAAKRATGERDDRDILAYGVKVVIKAKVRDAVIGQSVRVNFSR
ncbi:biotin/lipoyl attachment domain-containing protein [Thermincola ferriacetica]|uniref:Biotin/lipoyl attachment domain-containing protein n=1 Tax=Thermincola ferriacetica TaxID=281456 RepID=A0A0L6VZ94_9FIRM|nr:HlyD family efflux transporter periplasmic adaptor subunit [Thermincola ferriacetica]KNZ68453.1 biotin/lipoyl attachment domain-containing protein [Thermincola ferriacetica]